MITRLSSWCYGLCVLLFFASTLHGQSQSNSRDTTLGFDGLADLATDVGDFGVSFTGATVLACGGSLNCTGFPPFSGRNVIFDQPGFGGVITAKFDKEVTGRVARVLARVTGNRNVTMTAFSSDGTIIGSDSTGGANFVGAGTGILPNKLLGVETKDPDISIDRVVFRDGGNTFTIDDFTFTASGRTVVLDAGHGSILKNGVPTYQRPATPTFGLYEDQLTLAMASYAKFGLESLDVPPVVYMTRDGDRAPFAPANCPIPCVIDINKRRIQAEKWEADVLVSIHTNAGPPTANGTEVFYRTNANNSGDLANALLNKTVALGLKSRGIKLGAPSNILLSDIPSSLIEVAFHSNSQLAAGQAITDEERLNSASFRLSAGIAIAEAIQDFIVNVLNKKEEDK
jgi:N-acetylmuramoyl-L-alanine amidase